MFLSKPTQENKQRYSEHSKQRTNTKHLHFSQWKEPSSGIKSGSPGSRSPRSASSAKPSAWPLRCTAASTKLRQHSSSC